MPSDPQTAEEGYYWARHEDGTTFVVLREGGKWFAPGVHKSIGLSPTQVMERISQPNRERLI
jgi:hypothetical protein